jgi:predicted metalloendopeptidase
MDEAHANQARLAPVAADLAAVDRMTSTRSLPALLADRATKGIPGFFGFGSEQDAKDSAKVIGAFNQGGLGLPSKDYYLDETENAKTHPREVPGPRGEDVRAGGGARRAPVRTRPR